MVVLLPKKPKPKFGLPYKEATMRKLTRRDFLKSSSAAAGIARVGQAVELWASSSGTGLKSEVGAAATFYVATNGNDGWSGKLAEPNGMKTDGPFVTLGRARDAVRELKGKQGPKEPLTVMGRGGKYYLEGRVVFGAEDRGSEEV